MIGHEVKHHQVEMTNWLMEFADNARKKYFFEQKEREMKKRKTKKMFNLRS